MIIIVIYWLHCFDSTDHFMNNRKLSLEMFSKPPWGHESSSNKWKGSRQSSDNTARRQRPGRGEERRESLATRWGGRIKRLKTTSGFPPVQKYSWSFSSGASWFARVLSPVKKRNFCETVWHPGEAMLPSTVGFRFLLPSRSTESLQCLGCWFDNVVENSMQIDVGLCLCPSGRFSYSF